MSLVNKILKEALLKEGAMEDLYNSTPPKNKKRREALAQMISFKSMDVVPERDFLKAFSAVQSIPLIPIPHDFDKQKQIPYEIYKYRFEKTGAIGGSVHHFSSSNNEPQVQKVIKQFIDWKEAWKKYAPKELLQIFDQNIHTLQTIGLPLAQEIDEIRSKVKSAKEIKQIEVRQQIKGRTHPEIQQAVDMIAEDFRKIIEQNNFKYFIRMIDLWKQKSKEVGATDPYKIFPSKHDADIRGVLQDLLKTTPIDSSRGIFSYAPKTESEIQEIALEQSKREVESFAFKMASKLGGLLPMNKKIRFTVNKLKDRSIDSNTLKFSINDGESSFLVQNQIVSASSKYNHPFYRYPTTFHDLIVKGQRVKSPDEITVKQNLNSAYA